MKCNYNAQKMYQIYLQESNKILKPVKSIDQYHPHKAFEHFYGYLTGNGVCFEKLFPKYVFYNDFSALSNLIQGIETDLTKVPAGKTNSNYKTYFQRFLDFLKILISPQNKPQKDLLKKSKEGYIDGINELVEALGGINSFLKKAVASSYFFDPDVVLKRSNEIIRLYSYKDPIPARWQSLRRSGIRPQCNYPFCDIDANGNSKVRTVIENLTGYTVSAGESCVFTNFKISHIWGNAQNPRYFTNLWNIVLIPAWVNDLLDKPTAAKGSIASKVLNTYKAICEQYYNIKNLPLHQIGLNPNPTVDCPADKVRGTYILNSIGAKGNNQYGNITVQKVTI